MRHAQAYVLMQPLIEFLKDVDYVNKLVQVSMNRPSMNWALLDNLSVHWKEENAYPPNFIGSCGLHILHGSFGTASKKTDSNLEASLKSFYKNSKDRLAHWADYLELNGLTEMHDQKCSLYLFPMRYCGHRWLENIPVIDCIIKILPKLEVYSNEI